MKSHCIRRSSSVLLVLLLGPGIAVAQTPAAPPATTPAVATAPAPSTPKTQGSGSPTAQAPAKPNPQAPGKPTAQPAANATTPPPAGVVLPPGYVIGADDVLAVVFWRDKDMSTEVVVRPDGKISLPLLNDVDAAGLTPEQLRVQLTEAAGKLIEEPTIAVVVKTINSRKVFVTGQVGKPGPYPLSAPTTVLQLLATAGGVLEYAHSKDIRIMRTENGKQVSHKFNYKDVIKGKNLKQNIELKPGDTVIVP